MLLAIIAINHKFYSFLGYRMGWLTALTAVPFHVLFYFYSGLAFMTGVAAYAWRSILGGRFKAVRDPANP
jgi:hypothetical protein